MIFYHGTSQENWKAIQQEGILYGRRYITDNNGKTVKELNRCTYLTTDLEEAKHYGEIVLQVEYDPNSSERNNYVDGCWQMRVYEPIPLSQVKLLNARKEEQVMTQEENIITLLNNCKDAVINRDIVALIDYAKSFGLDGNSNSPLLDFIRNLIVEDIKNFIVQNKKDSIKISRKNVYHQETFDCYSLKDGELFRNGFKATFSSIGKLYIAYKRIHNID